MARIRSIHPGLFTDEAFMTATAHGRLLIIGIWCEAWDDGVFEWKPLTLKARIFPVDAVEVPELLAELELLGFIRPFVAAGKQWGAIRNFRKFQRPKKPNDSGMLPDDLALYVGLSTTSSEPVRNQFGTSGEKSPQMEDGGGRKEEVGKEEREEVPSSSLRSEDGGGDVVFLRPPDSPNLTAESKPEPQSDEDRYWSLAGGLQKQGVARSMVGKLANLLNGSFDEGVGILRDVERAKSPSAYLGAIIRNRQKALEAPSDDDEGDEDPDAYFDTMLGWVDRNNRSIPPPRHATHSRSF